MSGTLMSACERECSRQQGWWVEAVTPTQQLIPSTACPSLACVPPRSNQAPTFCLAKPGSITYTMPSMVSDVSAMLVETMILRPAGPPGRAAGGAGSKMRCCCWGGSVE